MKKILVCGAGGFIGGHLVTKLKELGHWVRAVDIKNHEYKKSDADEFIVGDLTLWEVVDKVVDNSIDEIYQLAADMGGANYVFTGDHDADIMYNSCQINLNICKSCIKYGVKKVFYSSSACMYPEHNQLDPENPNCAEDSAYPANPDSEYGWEKLFSERLYLSFKRNYGLDVKIARFHNIFGPLGTWRGGKEKAPAALCRKIAMCPDGGEIEVMGDGKQTRSFLFIDECVEGVLRLMDSDWSGPVNIGSDEMVSITETANKIIKISGKNIMIKYVPGPQGVRGRNSDNKLIKEKLGWRPTEPLVNGLTKTYNWISQQIQKQNVIDREKLTVIGIGKLGLCTALCLEKAGYDVLGVDLSPQYVESVNNKTLESHEPSVNDYLQLSSNLKATTSLKEGLEHSDIFFVVVDTPNGGGKNFYDHSKLCNLLVNINKHKVENKHIIVCCTVMPTFIQNIGKLLIKDCKNTTLNYNPEFIAQGAIIKGFEYPDILLIGEETKEIGDRLEIIYKNLVKNTPKFCRMSPTEAEIVKISINGFITNKISYANMIGDACNKLNADNKKVLSAIGGDSRIGRKYFNAGYSFGGPCFPRDTQALGLFIDSIGINSNIIQAVRDYNEYHAELQAEDLLKLNLDVYEFKQVTYKEDCDVPIIEESAKLKIAEYIAKKGKKVVIKDKEHIIIEVKKTYGNLFVYKCL